MGVPVIATKCGGPQEFVNNKNGLMVDVNSLKQLTQAMEYMYSNIDNYHRKNISIDIKERFSSEKVAQDILAIYRKL